MQILINIVLGLFILVAVVMILVILMQRPKSEGLGAAFGGGMTDNLFGAQTTNVLVKFTGWLAGLFFALTFLLSVLYAHYSIPVSGLRQELMKDQATTTALPSATPDARCRRIARHGNQSGTGRSGCEHKCACDYTGRVSRSFGPAIAVVISPPFSD